MRSGWYYIRYAKDSRGGNNTIFGQTFQCINHNESVPDDWKSALIVPIFKSGQKCEVQNYRPLLSNSIRNHLDQTEWFFRGQHGFRNGFSCESQIISLTQDLSEVIDLGGRVDAIVIDFAKCLM